MKNLVINLLKLMPYKWRRELDHCLFIVDYEEDKYMTDLKRFDIPKDIINWQKEQNDKTKK